jgi:hypothetical protein
MALIRNRFEGCNIITRAQGFSGPTPSNAPRNAVALLKTITYRAIKTTGTLIVIIMRAYQIYEIIRVLYVMNQYEIIYFCDV